MHAIVNDIYGTPDVLELRDLDRPEIGDDEVLLRVHAASVNPLDWHFLTGTPYLLRLMAGFRGPKQIVRGVDVAGVVEQVGAEVDGVEPGDRVFGGARGSFAEYAVASPDSLAPIPAGLSFAEAGAMGVAGVTALEALRDQARVRPGDRVLINGAAGGVGTFVVQLAVAMGADVTAVCSTRNVEMVRSLGAHHVVDYTTEDFVTHGPFDALIDNVGNRRLTDCRDALAPHGVMVMVSGPKGKWIKPFDRAIAARVRFLRGERRFTDFTATEDRADLSELAGYVERGELRVVVDRHYPLADVAEAVRYVATGHARAKVVIDVVEHPDAADARDVTDGSGAEGDG